jgi:starvation-inducible DNA-binding protein
MKLHNYHWYVKGPEFFNLHIKFEELYNEAGLHLDVIAERILALRGQPIATMKEQLAAASIKEARGTENANQMVSQLANDFEMLTGELTKAIEDAEKNEDQPSADMLIGIRQSIEKHTWMMKAYLG